VSSLLEFTGFHGDKGKRIIELLTFTCQQSYMYFTSLPDHRNPDFDEPAHFSRFQQQNIIFNAISNKSHCDRHVGCLSIKTVRGGEEHYGVGKRRLTIRPGQLLILNNDQEYSCRIDTAG